MVGEVVRDKGPSVSDIDCLWNRGALVDWQSALAHYWDWVRPELRTLEERMESLDPSYIAGLDAQQWYEFLLNEYFRWKYTAPNRYGSTTKWLKTYQTDDDLRQLDEIRERILTLDPQDIRTGLKTAEEIRGLGVAGASGLLALLYPRHFGTVDQFVVKALKRIPDDPSLEPVRTMDPKKALSLRQGTQLIELMRHKAGELNAKFSTSIFTPRAIDKVLWACRDEPHGKRCCGI